MAGPRRKRPSATSPPTESATTPTSVPSFFALHQFSESVIAAAFGLRGC